MSRRKQSNRSARKNKRQVAAIRRKNNSLFLELLNWFVPERELFSKNEFHGNTKWNAEQLAVQALIWSWQETKYVTDAFDHIQEICEALGMKETAKSYTSMMNALDRYHDVFAAGLRERIEKGLNWYELVPVLDDLAQLMITSAPRSASFKAIDRPNPVAEPVTIALRPARSFGCVIAFSPVIFICVWAGMYGALNNGGNRFHRIGQES